jgi:hypothetical protein
MNRENLPRNRKVLVVTRRHDAATVQLVLMLVFSTEDESYVTVDGKEIGDVFHSEGDALQAAIDVLGGQNIHHIRLEELP